jgi:hypothetical protein
MKTYPLYLTAAQLRLVHDLLNSAVDDLTGAIVDLIETARGDAESSAAPFTPFKSAPNAKEMKARGASLRRDRFRPARKPVTRKDAISLLSPNHPDASKALSIWRNKAETTLGWDRWLKSAYPMAAILLWPDSTQIRISA